MESAGRSSHGSGKHTVYAKLVAAVNRLLQQDGIYDPLQTNETALLLQDLGIVEAEANMELQKVLACQEELNQLAHGFMI